ncbi:MAG: TetR/AcrR family transcriptional regulator [Desulfatibacillum sp.]|nr:TetR/AcrR family transcriptional regulator [Desulfatibacillum sp.]
MSGPTKAELRKEKIIDTARRIFAEKGVHAATVSEIAQEAKVSEGTIYEHFSNKENLLFHIPEDFTKRRQKTGHYHLNLIQGAANKLRAFAYIYTELFYENPDYATISLLYLKGNPNFRQTPGYQSIQDWFRHLTEIIEEGIESGEFRTTIQPYIIRALIMGAIDQVTVNWLMAGKKTNLMETVDPIIDAVMEGILNPEVGEDAHWSNWHRTKARLRNKPTQDNE